MRLTNCKNCGAPLVDNKCEYCGSEYEYISEINDFMQTIELYICGRKRKFYIGSVKYNPITESYRTLDGNLHCNNINDEIDLHLISYE